MSLKEFSSFFRDNSGDILKLAKGGEENEPAIRPLVISALILLLTTPFLTSTDLALETRRHPGKVGTWKPPLNP